jgi:hypothetical protein
MSTTARLTVTDLAGIAFRKYETEAMDQGDALFDQQRDEFLSCARATAASTLGKEAAEQLDWVYTGTADLPPDTEQATALLDGGPNYIRYRYTSDDEAASFELVQPCGSCHRDRIDEVTSLIKLGALLEEAQWEARRG